MIELCIRDETGCIVAWQTGYSNDEIENILAEHPTWYRSSVEIVRET